VNLVFDSRFVSFALRVSGARKADDEAEFIDLTGGNFEPAPVFGFQSTEEDPEDE
jgi:hypothetical protein